MNTFKSKAFLKIKQNIQSSKNALHLQVCERMIECSTNVLTKDELTILMEYYFEAKERYCLDRHKGLCSNDDFLLQQRMIEDETIRHNRIFKN